MACHAARRASRGCAEVGVDVDVESEPEPEERLERRVSWMPGADGAPWEVSLDLEALVVLDVEVGCEEGGAMRRDCGT